MENFWSLLKRGLNGTYVSAEPFHLFRYVDEQAFRFNNRTMTDEMRFRFATANLHGTITFTIVDSIPGPRVWYISRLGTSRSPTGSHYIGGHVRANDLLTASFTRLPYRVRAWQEESRYEACFRGGLDRGHGNLCQGGHAQFRCTRQSATGGDETWCGVEELITPFCLALFVGRV